MKEQDILKTILLGLNSYGRYWRNNTGAVKTDDRYIRYGLCKGSSDIIGITDIDGIGVFTAFEVKTKRGKPTHEQVLFIGAIRSRGGIAGIVRSLDEAVGLIEAYRDDYIETL